MPQRPAPPHITLLTLDREIAKYDEEIKRHQHDVEAPHTSARKLQQLKNMRADACAQRASLARWQRAQNERHEDDEPAADDPRWNENRVQDGQAVVAIVTTRGNHSWPFRRFEIQEMLADPATYQQADNLPKWLRFAGLGLSSWKAVWATVERLAGHEGEPVLINVDSGIHASQHSIQGLAIVCHACAGTVIEPVRAQFCSAQCAAEHDRWVEEGVDASGAPYPSHS